MTIFFITGRDIPEAAICVVRERGLKEMIANLHQVTEGMRTGADRICDTLLPAFTVPLKSLKYTRSIRANGESGFGSSVLKRSIRLSCRGAQRMGHRRLPVALHLFRMAAGTAFISADCG